MWLLLHFRTNSTCLLKLATVAIFTCWPALSFAQLEDENTGLTRAQNFPLTEEESHSRREASDSLLLLASQNPEVFFGKTLMLKNGREVGPVIAVRRKLDNLFLYLVIDATTYFNEPTIYAVQVSDIESMTDTRVLMSQDQGMHVRGLVYYEDDYTAPNEHFPEQALDD